MNCPECGTDLPENSAFCLQCGAQVGGGLSAPADPLLQALEQTIGSQYQMVRLLGRGGMGAVYLGRDQALDRLVAIKVLPPESTDAENTERFRREARTAAKLTHPNIVPLYTFGEGQGILYFVMGYVSGESLRDRIARLGRIEPQEARRTLIEVAGALHYAHQQNVVHRDVKPDNILLEDDTGQAMLTDFGVAKMTVGGETLTALGTALGTPYYMSPEQAAGDRNIDGRSDLYSLGIIGYQMLGGQLPFEGESVQEILVQHMTREPTPLVTIAPSTPADLADAVSRCLAKSPDDRVADAQMLQHYLGNTDGSEDELSGPLADFARDVRPVPWAMVGTWYFTYWLLLWGEPLAAAGFFTIGAMGPLMIIGERNKHNLNELSWKSVFRRMLRKPKWWSGWWPRALRQADDIWDRLPPVVRKARAGSTALVGVAAMTMPLILRGGFGAPDLLWIHGVTRIAAAITVPAVGVWIWLAFRANRWLHRAGMTSIDRERFINASESDTRFWRQPHVLKLLGPPTSEVQHTGALSPHRPQDVVAALQQAARAFVGPERAIGEAAARAGSEIVAALASAEQRIESLARDADPAEQARLTKRLAELGESQSGESDAQRRMRVLVEEQLELGRSLADQLAAATARRDHLMDLLKTLWLHVVNLQARASETAFDSRDISGQIHAITQDIQRYVDAADETGSVLGE